MIFGIFRIFRFFTCLERVGNGPDVTVGTKNLRGLGISISLKKSCSKIFAEKMLTNGPETTGYWESQQVSLHRVV